MSEVRPLVHEPAQPIEAKPFVNVLMHRRIAPMQDLDIVHDVVGNARRRTEPVPAWRARLRELETACRFAIGNDVLADVDDTGPEGVGARKRIREEVERVCVSNPANRDTISRHAGLTLNSGHVVVSIGMPFEHPVHEAMFREAKRIDVHRPQWAVVLIDDAHLALTLVQNEMDRLVRQYYLDEEIKEAARRKEMAALAEAERKRQAQIARDKPYKELPPAAAAALCVASALPKGELRDAFLRFATVLRRPEPVGAPENEDPEIRELAIALASH